MSSRKAASTTRSSSKPRKPGARGPLSGRVILDCSILLPGPFVGKLLAAQGARVIKVENPKRPDPARELHPAYYEDLNEMKKVVLLDLTDERDRRKFRELVKK